MATGTALDPFGALRQEMEEVSQSEGLPVDERIGKLRLMVEDLTDLLGRAQTYVSDLELVRDGRDPAYRERVMEVRENADIRAMLIDRGFASAEEMDALGMLSHEDIDRLAEERLLESWIEESFAGDLERVWDEAKHPRGQHGKFSDALGRPVVAKGRHGRAVAMPKGKGAAGPVVHDASRAAAEVPNEPRPHLPGSVTDRKPRPAAAVASDVARARDLDGEAWVRSEAERAIVGDASSTQEMHSVVVRAAGGQRRYTKEREALHDRIVDTLLRQRRPVDRGDGTMEMHPHPEGEYLPRSEQPTALMMAGGTASGKSTALALPENQGIIPKDAVHIDPDEIKAMLPEYSQLVAAGSRQAASVVHEESSEIAGRVRAEAVKRGLNIVLDGTGDSDPGKTAAKLKQLHDSGYNVHMLYVNAPTDVAIANAADRASRTGRWVSEAEIRRQHKNVSARFVSDVQPLVSDGTVAHVRMFHNEGNKPVLMAEGKASDLQVYEPELFDKFVHKAEEPA